MKKSILLFGALCLAGTSLFSQFKQKDVELAFSGTLGSWSAGRSSGGSSNSESMKYFSLFLEPGYYLANSVSLEPEFGMMAVEQEQPAFYIIGNISYTYLPPDSKTALFVLAGYGISNAVQYPLYNNVIMRISKKMDVTVLNAAFGIKALVNDRVALRVGFNYKDHRRTPENSGYYYYGVAPSQVEYTYSNVGLLVGLSVLL